MSVCYGWILFSCHSGVAPGCLASCKDSKLSVRPLAKRNSHGKAWQTLAGKQCIWQLVGYYKFIFEGKQRLRRHTVKAWIAHACMLYLFTLGQNVVLYGNPQANR